MSSVSTPTVSPVMRAGAVAWIGLAGLAVAMGIGRFAFTPVLPLMQQEGSVTLVQGGWLATANYLGYLAGALICIGWHPGPARAVRWGLLSIAVLTFAMGLTEGFWIWLILRLLAGAASAFVLVGVSAWAMPRLALARKKTWSGYVFSGVGVGICATGVICLAAGSLAFGARSTWICLGGVAAVFALALWLPLRGDDGHEVPETKSRAAPLSGAARLAALCYGAFGYGYIIPATFLPALAREVITDPLLFGLIWPVFGAAGAISTLCAAAFLPHHSARRLWIRAQWILAAGVIAPVFTINLYVLLFSALCVGGTFMVITMAGIREARRLGGTSAARLIALYTAAFALGQILGPPTVSLFHGGLAAPSVLAAFVLVASSLALGRGASAPETSE